MEKFHMPTGEYYEFEENVTITFLEVLDFIRAFMERNNDETMDLFLFGGEGWESDYDELKHENFALGKLADEMFRHFYGIDEF